MDTNALQQRLAFLREQQMRAAKVAEQAVANLQAFGGAIQECEFWLAQIKAAEDKPEMKVVSG